MLLHHYHVLPRKYYHPHHQPLPNHSHYPHHHHFLISPTITLIVIPTSLITITTIITTNFSYVILDSLGFWNPCCGFRISGPGSRIHCQLNLDSRFQSLAGFCIPRTRDSRFHKQTFLAFQILQPNFRGISEHSLGFWNPCCGFWTPGPGFPIPSQWNLDSGSQSLAGFRIPRTPDSKFHKPIFPGFQILQPNFRGIWEDSLGVWIPGPGFRIPSQWNLDSGSQSLAGFRIPRTPDSKFHKPIFPGFQILQPNFRGIWEDSLGVWIPGPGFRIPSQWNLDSGSPSLAGFRIP